MKKKRLVKHETECFICFEMARRGYNDGQEDREAEYWDDCFNKKEKPIMYELRYKGKPFTKEDVKEIED